jgi:DNA mismatch endonuclease (patch repair protein)
LRNTWLLGLSRRTPSLLLYSNGSLRLPDVVDAATRSRMMAGIRGVDTKPEMIIRRGLHAAGFRYRLHERQLAGRPDLVLPRHRAIIFVHGCFWHRHDCQLFQWPKSRESFWREKIEGNVARDAKAERTLQERGWRILRVWECSLKGPGKLGAEAVVSEAAKWLNSTAPEGDIRGS